MTIPNIGSATLGDPIERLDVSFFPVYLDGNPLPDIATGREAGLKIGELERPSVPTLSVANPTNIPILIVQGEQFLGGDQNRTLNISILVPALAALEVPVSCLEAGRWGRRRTFVKGAAFAPPSVRRIANESVLESARLSPGSRYSNQGAVWEEVETVLEARGVQSPSRAMADADAQIDQGSGVSDAIRELVEIGPQDGQCGVAVTHGGNVIAVELFGAPNLFAPHWEALVRSHLADAYGRSRQTDAGADAARAMLRGIAAADAPPQPAIGDGEERHLSTPAFTGQALTLGDAIVHLSAFSSAPKRSRRRSRGSILY